MDRLYQLSALVNNLQRVLYMTDGISDSVLEVISFIGPCNLTDSPLCAYLAETGREDRKGY